MSQRAADPSPELRQAYGLVGMHRLALSLARWHVDRARALPGSPCARWTHQHAARAEHWSREAQLLLPELVAAALQAQAAALPVGHPMRRAAYERRLRAEWPAGGR